MKDTEIVDLYWARAESAIEETRVKYGKYCRSVAMRILENEDDAEEVVNDTYLGAWNSIPPHRPEELSTFLGKLTRRLAIKKWQKDRALKRGGGQAALALEELGECVPSGPSPEQEVEAEELERAVRDFVSSLPDTQRDLFVCRYWYLDPIHRICRQFGFSENKVKSALHRTRKKLKNHLIKEGLIHGR